MYAGAQRIAILRVWFTLEAGNTHSTAQPAKRVYDSMGICVHKSIYR
jgi:hypothetical protein